MTTLRLSLLAAISLLAPQGLAQVDCEQGCTPGYWKAHQESWDGVGNDFTDSIIHSLTFNALFSVTTAQSGLADTVTLLEAANLGNGDLNALNRHAAAAMPSADSLACYPYSVSEVIALYRDGVDADPGPEDVISARILLDAANNLGCPYPDRYWRYCFGEAGSCPCTNASIDGGCVNSTGAGGTLDVIAGGASTVADDLVISAGSLPPNQFAIFIAAQGHQSLPFLDGNLCIGGPGLKIVRHSPPTLTSEGGSVTLGPGIVAESQSGSLGLPAIVGINAGENWFFQAYYRDPAGPCGNGANTSNALAVMFY